MLNPGYAQKRTAGKRTLCICEFLFNGGYISYDEYLKNVTCRPEKTATVKQIPANSLQLYVNEYIKGLRL